MNINAIFKLFLVLSIALQSLSTVASEPSQNHQISAEHHQAQHEHKHGVNSLKTHLAEEGHHLHDCHSCGHCSGGHLSWIVIQHSNVFSKSNSTNQTPYLFNHTKGYSGSIIRPPIS